MDYTAMTDQELLKQYKEKSHHVAMLKTKQMAFKILLNSCYGAI